MLTFAKNKGQVVSKVTRNILGILSRFKFAITIFLGLLLVGVVDENSFIKLIGYHYQIEDLKDEVKRYDAQYKDDTNKLRAMQLDPEAVARIARERYFMKAANEDIFVLSDEEDPVEKTQK